MRAINLLPRDEQRVRLEGLRTPLLAAGGGVVVVTALAMFMSYSAAGAAEDRRTELAAVEAEIARLPKAPTSAVSQGMLMRERTDRVTALSAAITSRVAFDRLLREISFVFPENAWLTQFEATAPAAELPATDGPAPPPLTTTDAGVTIQGATYSHDVVAVVLARLAVVPSLENVRLTSTALVEPQAEADAPGGQSTTVVKPGRPFVTFVVSASLRSGASG
jgi:Tfp pilus assembly protein PilN